MEHYYSEDQLVIVTATDFRLVWFSDLWEVNLQWLRQKILHMQQSFKTATAHSVDNTGNVTFNLFPE